VAVALSTVFGGFHLLFLGSSLWYNGTIFLKTQIYVVDENTSVKVTTAKN